MAGEINCSARADTSAATICHTSSLLSSFYVLSWKLLEILDITHHSQLVANRYVCGMRRNVAVTRTQEACGCLDSRWGTW